MHVELSVRMQAIREEYDQSIRGKDEVVAMVKSCLEHPLPLDLLMQETDVIFPLGVVQLNSGQTQDMETSEFFYLHPVQSTVESSDEFELEKVG